VAFGPGIRFVAPTRSRKRRNWIDEQRFLDLVGATNLIPGPNATEMAIHLGLIRAGWPGLFASGTLFILPGMLATLLVAWAYVNYGSIPEVGWILYGVKPVVIGIIVEAIWSLGQKGFKSLTTAIVGIGVALLYLLGLNEIALLFGGAIVVLIIYSGKRLLMGGLFTLIPISIISPISFIKTPIVPFSQQMLFLSFLKIGSVLFGSGYVLLAFLRSEFVIRFGWLTNQQILDSIVAGQITPGPVFSSATFIGYLVGGWSSALIATLGIFLPSFIFVGLLSRILPFVRKSSWAGVFLDGVNASSLGLMAGVTVQLGQTALIDIFTAILSLVSILIIFRYRINFIWLIIGGGTIGAIYKLISLYI
jgi:chromate transporter